MRPFIALLFCFLCFHAHAQDVPEQFPEVIDQKMSVASKVRKSWDVIRNFHPENHNPDNFAYLITEIEAPKVTKFTLMQLRDLSLIQSNFRICASLIGNYNKIEFLGTFRGRIAFILDVPSENIGVMHWKDMASGPAPWSPKLTEVARYNGGVSTMMKFVMFGIYGQELNFYSPASLLQDSMSQDSSYNEVDVIGKNLSKGGSLTQVKGILVECDTKVSKKDPLKSIFAGKTSAGLDPALSREEKTNILMSCLKNDSTRTGEVLEAILDVGEKIPIILLARA